jgi:hypothetical protein
VWAAAAEPRGARPAGGVEARRQYGAAGRPGSLASRELAMPVPPPSESELRSLARRFQHAERRVTFLIARDAQCAGLAVPVNDSRE